MRPQRGGQPSWVTGKVVFPVRPRSTLMRFVPAAILGLSTGVSLHPDLDRPSNILILVSFVLLVGLGGWQLLTGRPVVTLDHDGIRVGRRKLLPWAEVATIGIPTGPPLRMWLTVRPKDRSYKKLIINQDNAKDLRAFASWLESQLHEQRRQNAQA